MTWRISFFLVLFFTSVSGADEIRSVRRDWDQVLIRYRHRGALYTMGSGVCIYGNNRRLGCGRIIRLTTKDLIVKLNDGGAKYVNVGEWVELYPTTRLPASVYTTVQRPYYDHFELGIGVAAGFNYFYPNLKLGFAVGRRFSLALEPLYIGFNSPAASVTAYGGFLTGNYFLTGSAFQGLYATLGIGYFSMELKQDTIVESISPMALNALLQWKGRGTWSLGMDLGAGLGLQYVGTKTAVLSTSFQGVLPLFTLTLGTSF